MTEPRPLEPPIEPYTTPLESLPDVDQLQQTVIDESRPGRHTKAIVAGMVAAALASGAVVWYAYDRQNGEDAGEEPAAAPWTASVGPLPETVADVCYSPDVARTFAGDPTAESDDPDMWTTGVLVTVMPPKQDDYLGTRIGFHGPEEPADATEWSLPLAPDQLEGTAALMRTGPGAYTIVVENVTTVGSALCDSKPEATFKQTSVDAALNAGAIEPDF